MTIRFRIIQVKNGFTVQTKRLWWWKYKTEVKDISMAQYPSIYETENGCINRVYGDSNYRKDRLTVIRYPNLIEIP